MSEALLVRGARQLLTLHGPADSRRGPALRELGILRDGALLIEDGRIAEVGVSRRIENLVQARRAQEIDATGRVVMPGFVDCCAQLVWGPPALDDYEAWIAGAAAEPAHRPEAALRALRSASARRLESRARHFVNGMARHGTTTLESASGYGLDLRGELKMLRAQARLDRAPLDIVSTFSTPRALPAAPESARESYLSWMCAELLPAIRRRALARFAGLRCDQRVLNLEQSRRFLETARSLGFQLKIHAGQWAAGQAVRLAVEAGAISVECPSGAAPPDLEPLSRANTLAVLLPGSALHDRDGRQAPARELIDGGAAVALGSNLNPGTCPTYSMQTIVALACAHLRMSPAEAICAATVNAAHAIGSGQTAGSLEVGRPADLIILNAADYREIPYHFGVNLVNRTIKRGQTIYQEGRVTARS